MSVISAAILTMLPIRCSRPAYPPGQGQHRPGRAGRDGHGQEEVLDKSSGFKWEVFMDVKYDEKIPKPRKQVRAKL